MKIIFPQISHKPDVGRIKLSLQNAAEARAAYKDTMENIPKKSRMRLLRREFNCSLCFQKAGKLLEWFDPTFGPMFNFGLGGVYEEILKDVKFAIAPVDESEAREMIAEIKAYPLLAGIRGAKPLDINALVNAI